MTALSVPECSSVKAGDTEKMDMRCCCWLQGGGVLEESREVGNKTNGVSHEQPLHQTTACRLKSALATTGMKKAPSVLFLETPNAPTQKQPLTSRSGACKRAQSSMPGGALGQSTGTNHSHPPPLCWPQPRIPPRAPPHPPRDSPPRGQLLHSVD